jgi:TetR/AcrR family transcriptional regulator, transcriptional repressor for nem operon
VADEPILRERLIDVAIDVFALKGYAAANLTDVTDYLKVSRGPVYYHFQDKYGLYKATFDRWEDSLRTSHGYIFSRKDKPILTQLGETIFNCIGLCRRYKLNYFVGLETLGELAELKERYHRLAADIYQEKITAVEAAIERGELGRKLKPERIVESVYVTYDGVRVGLDRLDFPLAEGDIQALVELQLSALGTACGCIKAPA